MAAKKKATKKKVAKKKVAKKDASKRTPSRDPKVPATKKTSGKTRTSGKAPLITGDKAREELKRHAGKIKKEDVGRVIDKSRQLEERFEEQGPLQKFLATLRLLLSLLKDYKAGRYKRVPWWVIAAVTAALLYVLNPLDLIPDFIPILGYVDDAAVLAACLALCGKELKVYERWRAAQ